MTEQEKREKAIDEMMKIFYRIDGTCTDDDCDQYYPNCNRCVIGRLYNAGYRKEEEVQKKMQNREKEIDSIIIYLMTMHGYCRGKAEIIAKDIVDYVLSR